MSSILRSKTVRKEGVTLFVKPDSPCYDDGTNVYDGNDSVTLFPFSYTNQTLDITYDGNNFKERMVNVTNNAPDHEAVTSIRILGGLYLATSLGANFKAYIRAWRAGSIDAGSPIEVVVAPQLLRVQEVALANLNSISNAGSWSISSSVPKSENYVTGDNSNQYKTTYIFKTPLTFSIIEGGVKKYLTFRTILDQE